MAMGFTMRPPALLIQSTGRHHAMQMGMQAQVTAPGVEDSYHSELSAYPAGIMP
jgi:hypothetical protein